MSKERNKRHKTQFEKKLAASTKSTNQAVETNADIVTARQVEDYAYRHRGESEIDPVCGLKKFYKNEFEAFEKYFIKIHHPVGDTIFNAMSQEIMTLSDQPTCSLARKSPGDPYKLEFFREPFNVKYPPVPAPNKMIEFAHASIKIAKESHIWSGPVEVPPITGSSTGAAAVFILSLARLSVVGIENRNALGLIVRKGPQRPMPITLRSGWFYTEPSTASRAGYRRKAKNGAEIHMAIIIFSSKD
ncbi:hypothetical protein HUJ05_004684 [Dendroctonus ponderosae]|nr:hypothetical protein HUJ05_004684 [Dendroctonus ponderosae]